MSEEFQQRMFEAFAQEQQHISGREGTGLGLSIVKSIVSMMDGTISVDSRQGQGSTFTVDLPVTACALPQTMQDLTERRVSLQGKHILLCEDHPINRQLAQRLLERVGVMVTCAENGKEGFELFNASYQHGFDAILMDIRMPVMDGMQASRAIRTLERADAKTVPIIAMTANAFADDVQNCKNAGMTGHLAKPFKVDDLYRILTEQIGR